MFQVVNVSDLNRFADGETVSPDTLSARGLAKKRGVAGEDLGSGELARKLVVEGAKVSKAAREKIEKMGGRVVEGDGGEAQAK